MSCYTAVMLWWAHAAEWEERREGRTLGKGGRAGGGLWGGCGVGGDGLGGLGCGAGGQHDDASSIKVFWGSRTVGLRRSRVLFPSTMGKMTQMQCTPHALPQCGEAQTPRRAQGRGKGRAVCGVLGIAKRAKKSLFKHASGMHLASFRFRPCTHHVQQTQNTRAATAARKQRRRSCIAFSFPRLGLPWPPVVAVQPFFLVGRAQRQRTPRLEPGDAPLADEHTESHAVCPRVHPQPE